MAIMAGKDNFVDKVRNFWTAANDKHAAFVAKLPVQDKNTFYPGTVLSGQRFTIDENVVTYKNAYGKNAMIPRKSIETVTIDVSGKGYSLLKFIGKGTELAVVKLPHSMAKSSMLWFIEQLDL